MRFLFDIVLFTANTNSNLQIFSKKNQEFVISAKCKIYIERACIDPADDGGSFKGGEERPRVGHLDARDEGGWFQRRASGKSKSCSTVVGPDMYVMVVDIEGYNFANMKRRTSCLLNCLIQNTCEHNEYGTSKMLFKSVNYILVYIYNYL